MNERRVLRVSRAVLAAAVLPDGLREVLQSLVDTGVLEGFEEYPAEVVLWGDLDALECRVHKLAQDERALHEINRPPQPKAHPRLSVGSQGEDAARDYDTTSVFDTPRASYYKTAAAYIHTRSYRSLPKVNRQIWRLHALGRSDREIAFQLQVSPMKVRWSLRGARLAARLPVSTSAMPRGGGLLGRPVNPDAQCRKTCHEPGCIRLASAKGFCNLHYHSHRRRQRKENPNNRGDFDATE